MEYKGFIYQFLNQIAMEIAELQGKIREVYKLINYQNVEFEWNENLRQARKILNEIQSELHQSTVRGALSWWNSMTFEDQFYKTIAWLKDQNRNVTERHPHRLSVDEIVGVYQVHLR